MECLLTNTFRFAFSQDEFRDFSQTDCAMSQKNNSAIDDLNWNRTEKWNPIPFSSRPFISPQSQPSPVFQEEPELIAKKTPGIENVRI
jgi:hypothetical protein